ncbi:hypothetical protein FisN_26Lh063 [Fistulifera solaris]|uniref:Uncharacterized protein n=1 Tax=Fistulifera solaris TaxID=1519565 RepID=A0A1Z5KCH0_FISSO|nr:hypothetical protein FisN_26Lh063 [Fistulifera solaris]|eukprot:GAX24000.1 hypothetical protein FisN_26Lh063 [Fistulifera solaris]
MKVVGMKMMGLVPRNRRMDDSSSSSSSSSSEDSSSEVENDSSSDDNSSDDDHDSSLSSDASSSDNSSSSSSRCSSSSSDSSTDVVENNNKPRLPKKKAVPKQTKPRNNNFRPFRFARRKQYNLQPKEPVVDDVPIIEPSLSQMTNTPDKLLLAGGPRVASPAFVLSPHPEEEEEMIEPRKTIVEPRETPFDCSKDDEIPLSGPNEVTDELAQIQAAMEAKRRRLSATIPSAPIVHSRRLPIPHIPPTESFSKDEIVTAMHHLKVKVVNLPRKEEHPPSRSRPLVSIQHNHHHTPKIQSRPAMKKHHPVPKWKRVVEQTDIEVEEEEEEGADIVTNSSIPRIIHLNDDDDKKNSFESSLAPRRKMSRENENKARLAKSLLKAKHRPRFPMVDMDSIQAASQQPVTVPPKRTLALPTPGPLRSPDGGQISPGPVGGFSFDPVVALVSLPPMPVPDKEDNSVENIDEEQENNVPDAAMEMRPIVIGSKGETYDNKSLVTAKHSDRSKPRSNRSWTRPLRIKNRWNQDKKASRVVTTVDDEKMPLKMIPASDAPEPIETKLSSPKRKVSPSLDQEEAIVNPSRSFRMDSCTNIAAEHLRTGGLCGHDETGVNNVTKGNFHHHNPVTESDVNSVSGMRKFSSLFKSEDDASAQASTSGKTHVTTTTVKSQKTHIDQIEVEMNKGRLPFASIKRLFRRGAHPVKVSVASVPKTEEVAQDSADQQLKLLSPIREDIMHKQSHQDSVDDQQTSTKAAPLSVQVGLSDVEGQSPSKTDLIKSIEQTSTRAAPLSVQGGLSYVENPRSSKSVPNNREEAPHDFEGNALNDLGETIEKKTLIESVKPIIDDFEIAEEKSFENVPDLETKNHNIEIKSCAAVQGRDGIHTTLHRSEREAIHQNQGSEPVLATTLGDLFGRMFQTKKEAPDEAKTSEDYLFNYCGDANIEVIENQGIEVYDHNTITATSPTSKYLPTQDSSLLALVDDISLAIKSVKASLAKPLPPKSTRKKPAKDHEKKKNKQIPSRKRIDHPQVLDHQIKPKAVEIDIDEKLQLARNNCETESVNHDAQKVNLSIEPKTLGKKAAAGIEKISESTSSNKQQFTPVVEKSENASVSQFSNYFNWFGSSKKTQQSGEQEALLLSKVGNKTKGKIPRSSSAKRQDRLENIYSAGDDNDSMANTWAEIADASLIVERAMDRIHTFGSDVTDSSRKVQDLLSLGSLDTMGDDVEQALRVLRKHANRLGVRESELLLAVKSDGYESKDDDEESVRTLTFGEELMDAFNLYMNRPKSKKTARKKIVKK